jgi:hypothetical protein
MTEETYTFIYEYGDTHVEMHIGGELDVLEMTEQFENFLLSTGYRLREGQSLGIVTEKVAAAEDEEEALDEISAIASYIEGINRDVGHGSAFKYPAETSGIGAVAADG